MSSLSIQTPRPRRSSGRRPRSAGGRSVDSSSRVVRMGAGGVCGTFTRLSRARWSIRLVNLLLAIFAVLILIDAHLLAVLIAPSWWAPLLVAGSWWITYLIARELT